MDGEDSGYRRCSSPGIRSEACVSEIPLQIVSAEKRAKERRNFARIAVASDEAFCFTYKSNLSLLERLGAELVPFSPLRDRRLPADVDGLLLSGGYPELYAEQLESNKDMRSQIRGAVRRNMPTLAECGGFLYLHTFHPKRRKTR